jgi:hypothetical protein
MIPLKELPPNYQLHSTFNLSTKKAVLVLNLIGFFLLLFFGSLFIGLAKAMRPDFTRFGIVISSVFSLLVPLVVLVLMILLHEVIHGLFFWLYTHQRPIFAFKGAYAYAAAPDWYLPRNKYVVVGLSPLILISLAGLLLLTIAPLSFFPSILIVMIFNAAGAVGDLIVVGWLLLKQPDSLVRDYGDMFTVYQPVTVYSQEIPG